MVPLKGEKHFKPCSQNRILVPGFFSKFTTSTWLLSFLYRIPRGQNSAQEPNESGRKVLFFSSFFFAMLQYFCWPSLFSQSSIDNGAPTAYVYLLIYGVQSVALWSVNKKTKNSDNIQPSWPPTYIQAHFYSMVYLFYTQLYKMSILDSTYQYSNIFWTFPPPVTFTAIYTH